MCRNAYAAVQDKRVGGVLYFDYTGVATVTLGVAVIVLQVADRIIESTPLGNTHVHRNNFPRS